MGCSGSRNIETLDDQIRKKGYKTNENQSGGLALISNDNMLTTSLNTNSKLMIFIKRIYEYGNPQGWSQFDIPVNGKLIGRYSGNDVIFFLQKQEGDMILSIQDNPRRTKLLLDKESSIFYENMNWTFIAKLSICAKEIPSTAPTANNI